MKDEKKFRIVIILSSILVILSISYTVFQEYFASEVIGYAKRRIHYYRALSSKGLSLHEGQYWRKSH